MIEISMGEIRMASSEADLDFEEQFRFDYSGRFMYSGKCFGLTGSVADLAKFMAALGGMSWEGGLGFDLNEFAEKTSTDSMGREMIYYWPGVEVID